MLIKMNVKGIVRDPLTLIPIVILSDESGKKTLKIWIGNYEADAIAIALENISTPRPLTHDLTRNILKKLGANILSVVVTDLRENTYYAEIELELLGQKFRIDSRPSDAIALALRFKAPIFVDQIVFEKTRIAEEEYTSDEAEKLKEWLKNLKPEDFGKYKM